jgi:hypothetical protein
MDTFINNIYDKNFIKQSKKTPGETCYNSGNILIPGYVPNNTDSSGYYYTHINYNSMKHALLTLVDIKPAGPYIFVETGCAAHGTKSTLLWDKFVSMFGGKVYSVDLNPNAVKITRNLVSSNTTVTHSDSLLYLPTLTEPIDFVYLDSYDVDFLNPRLSAEHHLKEFNCIRHLLHKGTVILIDDTPGSPEWLDDGFNSPIYNKYKEIYDINMSGKGSLISLELENMGATKVLHQYQVLWVL